MDGFAVEFAELDGDLAVRGVDDLRKAYRGQFLLLTTTPHSPLWLV